MAGDLSAVVAHSLLGSMSVVVGAAHTLDRYGASLTADERLEIVARLVHHADHVMGVLGDVARGLRPEAWDALDGVGAVDPPARVSPDARPAPA